MRCGIVRVESNIVNIAAHAQIPAALEADAAIGGHEQPAALRGGHPVAGVMRRLLDVQHLESRGAGGPPRFAPILAAEDPLFIARHQKSALARIHANRRGIFPVQSGARVTPCGAAVVADSYARRVAEVDRAGRMAVHRNILQLGDFAAGQNLPSLAVLAHSNQTVARRHVQRAGVGRIIVQGVDEGMIVAGVPPFPRSPVSGRFRWAEASRPPRNPWTSPCTCKGYIVRRGEAAALPARSSHRMWDYFSRSCCHIIMPVTEGETKCAPCRCHL